MSWFGDGFNQLKGQLSSFAKVLVEDADGNYENEQGSVLVGSSEPQSSQATQDCDGIEIRRPRQRQASEGWTDVQLQAPSHHDGTDKCENKVTSDVAFSNQEQVASSNVNQSSAKSNEKDVGSILRGGIASLIQKGKEQLEPLSPSKNQSSKVDRETQTTSEPDGEFSVHDRIVTNLQQTIHTLDQQNERLRQEVIRLTNELEAQAAASQDENANLSTGMEELDMQHQRAIERIMEVKEEALREFEVLKVKHASLEEEVAELRQRAAIAEEAADMSKRRGKADLVQELEDRDSEVEHLEGENASLRDAIHELTAQLDRSRDALPTLFEESGEQNEELETLRNRVKELEEGLKMMDDESVHAVELLRKSNSEMKAQLIDKNEKFEKAASSMKALEEKCEGLEWETEELRAKVDCAKAKALEAADLKTELEQLKGKDVEIENLKSELEEAMKNEVTISQLKIELERLKAIESEVNKLKSELETATNTEYALKSELELMKTSSETPELKAALECVKLKESEVAELKTELEHASELTSEITRLKAMEAELTKLKTEFQHAKKTELERIQLLNSKDEETAELKAELNKLKSGEAETTEVSVKISELKFELECSKANLAESTVALAQCEQELARTIEHLYSVEKSLEDTKSINDNLKRETESKDRRMCQILLESNAIEQELQSTLQAERTQHEEIVKQHQIDLETVNSEVKNLNQKLLELSSSTSNSDNVKLEDKINQLTDEKILLNETILELEMKVSSLTSQNEHLQSEYAVLSEMLNKSEKCEMDKETEIMTLKTAFERLQTEWRIRENTFITKTAKLQEESERYKIDREVHERKETEMKSRLQAKEEEMLALKHSGKPLESMKNSQDYEDLSVKYSKLVTESDSMKIQLTSLTEESCKYLSKIHELEACCVDITKERDNILLKISKLKDEYNNLSLKGNDEFKSQYEQERIQFLRKIESIQEQNAQLLADKVRLNADYSIERTCLIANHSSEVTSLKKEIISLESRLTDSESTSSGIIKKLKEDLSLVESERTELLRSIQMKHNECINYQTEVMRLNEVLKVEKNKYENAIVDKAHLEMKCQSLKSLQERVATYEKQVPSLESECQNLRDQLGYASELLKETKRQEAEGRCDSPPPNSFSCPNGCAQTQEELNKLAWSLHTEQANSKTLQMQVADFKEKAEKTEVQLARLQTHLVELEAAQTEEIVHAQDTMAELRSRLDAAEERARVSSTACTSANIRANQQVESLTQQVKLLSEQKEKLENEVSSSEDASLKQQAAITNLQAVLHQFQLDKQRDIDFETERIKQKLNQANKQNDEQIAEMKQLMDQLIEAKKGLDAASRLSEQMDKKSELISSLQTEVTVLKNKLKKGEQKLNAYNSNTEGKIDRNLVKNLIVGFICAPENSKGQVLRVLSSVLELAKEERAKIGLEASSSAQQQSLSQAFIKFLESESQPKPHIVLSVPPTPEGPSRRTSQTSISSGTGSILLSEGIQPLGPSLVRSGSILKDVLKEPSQSS